MKIETIQYGDYFAKINVSRGADCIRLYNKKYKAEILRVPDYDNLDNPYLYGMPVLFPVNRISGGQFIFEERVYSFPINEPNTNCALHGEMHCKEFEIISQSESQIVCLYRAKEGAYLGFPHTFEIEISYQLDEGGFEQNTVVRNCSDKNMPVLLGFHTTFRVPFVEDGDIRNIRIHADVAEEYERNMQNYLPTGNILSADAISEALLKGQYIPDQKLSRLYKAGASRTMEIIDYEKQCKVIYENDAKLGFRLIYNEGRGFICLEPQTCIANAPNSPFERYSVGFDHIEPGKEKSYRSHIKLATYK